MRRSRHHQHPPSPKRRHEYDETRRMSPRRFATSPSSVDHHWHADARSPRFGARPPSPMDRYERRPSLERRGRRRSPSPQFGRFGDRRYSPSYRHRRSPSGDRRRSRQVQNILESCLCRCYQFYKISCFR